MLWGISTFGNKGSVTQETTQETTQEEIALLLKKKPSIIRRELAKELSMSEDGIKYHLRRLKERSSSHYAVAAKKPLGSAESTTTGKVQVR